jgi:hypothetical protein
LSSFVGFYRYATPTGLGGKARRGRQANIGCHVPVDTFGSIFTGTGDQDRYRPNQAGGQQRRSLGKFMDVCLGIPLALRQRFIAD